MQAQIPLQNSVKIGEQISSMGERLRCVGAIVKIWMKIMCDEIIQGNAFSLLRYCRLKRFASRNESC